MDRAIDEIIFNRLCALPTPLRSKLGLFFVGDGCGYDNFIVSSDEIRSECNGIVSHFEDTSIHGTRFMYDAYFKIFVLDIPIYVQNNLENLIETVKNNSDFLDLFKATSKGDKRYKEFINPNSNGPVQSYANLYLFANVLENDIPLANKLSELLGKLISEINDRLPDNFIKIDYEGSGVLSYERFCRLYNDEAIDEIYKDDFDSIFSQLNSGYFYITPRNKIEYSRLEKIGLSESINKNSEQDINSLSIIKSNFPEIEVVSEFCELLNSNVKENILQTFIEKHPSLLNIFHQDCKIYPQLKLMDYNGKYLRPDFIIEPLETGRSIILDLKLSNVNSIKNKINRVSFYSKIYEYINQLRVYGNYFNSLTNRKWFEKKYGFSVFEPELILMVGNGYEHNDYNIIQELRTKDADGVHLLTYQQLVNQFLKN